MTHPNVPPLIDSGASSGRTRPGRVLVVDDQPDKLLTLEAALAPLGREIVKARSGRDALRWLLQEDFAVLLLDVNMPGMDGFETARLIRKRRRNEHTPIIFITGYGDEVHEVQGYSLGAVDYIVTPFASEMLRSKVKVFLELFERTAEVRDQAERLALRTNQLQALTHTALLIHEAPSIEHCLHIVVKAIREILGTGYASVLLAADQSGIPENQFVASPSERRGTAPGFPVDGELDRFLEQIARDHRGLSLEAMESSLKSLVPARSFPNPDECLAAPLRSRDGSVMGMLLTCGRSAGTFTEDDEALAQQLAEMSATAIENILFADAHEANRIKDEFLATLSHELRTPLAAILGWTQLLRSRALDPEEAAEAVEIIESNGLMQHKLVEDLLDISRITSGKMRLQLRDMQVSQVMRAAVDAILPTANARQISMETDLDDAEVRVCGDPDRLQQAFWNLLSNAVKFTPRGGQVEIGVTGSPSDVRVTIRDNGEGISPEFLPFVFDRFRQGDNSTTRKHGGLGIGLSVVRHIVELHGGTVEAMSEGKGRGATFLIVLPAAPANSDTPRGKDHDSEQDTAEEDFPEPVHST